MSTLTPIEIQRRIDLLSTQIIGQHLDDVMSRIEKLAQHFDKAKDTKEKSPLRNVLNVSTEPGSSLEVIKNYILYQVGRRGSSEIWKYEKGAFSKDLVAELSQLENEANKIVNEIKTNLLKSCQSQVDDAQGQEIVESYFSNSVTSLKKEIHLKLAQLYLGYLARKHTAWLGEKKPEKK